MIFQSVTFVTFFVVVFAVYWWLSKWHTAQNLWLLAASYFFYGYADSRMLPLLIGATLLFYGLGYKIAVAQTERIAKIYLWTGVGTGVGILFAFKYIGIFLPCVHIIVPIGISFFTFKLLSYIIETYYHKTELLGAGNMTWNGVLEFATYIAFFPTILAGPIDRPAFISQLQTPRTFVYNDAVEGCRALLWGAFLKMVVADTCALYVDMAWMDLNVARGSTLVVAAILYAVQIYADFAGYSSMAIGIALLLGLRVIQNFRTPFLSLNMADFWRRWHISLTQWLTDYVFMPLNIRLRRLGKWGVALATMVNMTLVGLWHGANFTYLLFGIYHGLLLVWLVLTGRNRLPKQLTWYQRQGRYLATFCFCVFGWIIFRAPDMASVGVYMQRLFSASLFSCPMTIGLLDMCMIVVSCLLMWCLDVRGRKHSIPLAISNTAVRWTVYFALTIGIWFVATRRATDFIYFAF